MTSTEELLENCIGYITELESGQDKTFWTNCLGFTDEELSYYSIDFDED